MFRKFFHIIDSLYKAARNRLKKGEQLGHDKLKSSGTLTESKILNKVPELIKLKGPEAFKAEISAFDEENRCKTKSGLDYPAGGDP